MGQNGKLEENTLTDIGNKLDANSMIDVAFPLEVMWSSTMADQDDHRGNVKNMKQGGFLTRSLTKQGKKNSLESNHGRLTRLQEWWSSSKLHQIVPQFGGSRRRVRNSS